MQVEYDALMKNGIWYLVDIPQGNKDIRYKWVFKTKYKANGILDKHKAWLIIKGYAQQEGIDYEEAFSPMTKMKTIKIAFIMVA